MMMRAPKTKFLLLALPGLLILLQSFIPAIAAIPITGYSPFLQPRISEFSIIAPEPVYSADKTSISNTSEYSDELEKFINEVSNGDTQRIKGIFSENVFELPVVQQPTGQPGFVSLLQNVVTEFAMPKKYGVTGILAHNFLAGEKFFSLEIGEQIQVIYGDGLIKTYVITSKQSYQALSPNSAKSEFVDLKTSEKISATQLFKRIYMGDHHLTLQTCIQKDNEDSWGRLFIIAEPV